MKRKNLSKRIFSLIFALIFTLSAFDGILSVSAKALQEEPGAETPVVSEQTEQAEPERIPEEEDSSEESFVSEIANTLSTPRTAAAEKAIFPPIAAAPAVDMSITSEKEFLSKFAGTYTTNDPLANRDSYYKPYKEWSIQITEKGEVKLLHNGEDTGALAETNWNQEATKIENRLTRITFTKPEWTITGGDLAFQFNPSGTFFSPSTSTDSIKITEDEEVIWQLKSSLSYCNFSIEQSLFKDYAGEYELNDGSGWKIIIDDTGKLSLSDGTVENEGAKNAYISYISYPDARTDASSYYRYINVKFANPDWYNSSKNNHQELFVGWQTVRLDNEYYVYNQFKLTNGPSFYKNDGLTLIKRFENSMCFANNEFMNEKLKPYAGEYPVTKGAQEQVEFARDLRIVIDEEGNAWLYRGEEKLAGGRAVISELSYAVRKDGSIFPYIYKIAFLCDNLYSSESKTSHYRLELEWMTDRDKNSDSYRSALGRLKTFADNGFTCYDENGEKKIESTCLHFDHETRYAEAIRAFLKPYVGKYLLSNGYGWELEISDLGEICLTDDRGVKHSAIDVEFDNFLSTDPEVPPTIRKIRFYDKDWFDSSSASYNIRFTLSCSWAGEDKTCTNNGDPYFYHFEKAQLKVQTRSIYFGDGTLYKTFNSSDTLFELKSFADGYFKDYQGFYSLSDGYTEELPALKGLRLYIDENGKISLYRGSEKIPNLNAVTGYYGLYGGNGVTIPYVSSMKICVPWLYTDANHTEPYYLPLNWNTNGLSPKAFPEIGMKGARYFTVSFIHCYDEEGQAIDLQPNDGFYFYHDDFNAKAKEMLKPYAGILPLNDGSDWYMEIAKDGSVTLTDANGKKHLPVRWSFQNYPYATNQNGEKLNVLYFYDPEWATSSGAKYPSHFQVNLSSTSLSVDSTPLLCPCFSVDSRTLYKVGTDEIIKSFQGGNYYFEGHTWADDYFKDYQGKYSLAQGYGEQFEEMKNWNLQIGEDGKIWLCDGDQKISYGKWLTGTHTIRPEIDRPWPREMKFLLPGLYANAKATSPKAILISVGIHGIYPSSNEGQFFWYFYFDPSNTGSATAYDAEGNEVILPRLTFHHEKNLSTGQAENALKSLQGTFSINDRTGWSIEIDEDGVPVLVDNEGERHSVAFYGYNNDADMEITEISQISTLNFVDKDWYNSFGKHQVLSFKFNAGRRAFYPGSTQGIYQKAEDGSLTLNRYFSSMAFFTDQKELDEAKLYFSRFPDIYSINDDSGMQIKIDEEGEIYLKIPGISEDFQGPLGYSATIKESKKEGVGRYVSSIELTLDGNGLKIYENSDCLASARLTLNWSGDEVRILDHQFVLLNSRVFYKDSQTPIFFNPSHFYGEIDRARAQEYLKKYPGTYKPARMSDAWYITIDENGECLVHVKDKDGGEIAIQPSFDNVRLENDYHTIERVDSITAVLPRYLNSRANDTLFNLNISPEITFKFNLEGAGLNFDYGVYFYPSSSRTLYERQDKNGKPWSKVTSSGSEGYYKDNFVKIYSSDRAYSEEHDQRALDYFKNHAGKYYIDDANLNYQIHVREDGQITWSDGETKPIEENRYAYVHFNGVQDENQVPKTIAMFYNGYYDSTTASPTEAYNLQKTQLGYNMQWNTASGVLQYSFTSSSDTLYKADRTTLKLPDSKYHYFLREDGLTTNLPEGKFWTPDGKHYIQVEGQGSAQTYLYDGRDSLVLFGTSESPFVRGKIGSDSSNFATLAINNSDQFICLQSFNGGSGTISKDTVFTLIDPVENGPVVLAKPNENAETGEQYPNIYAALHHFANNDTIYLKEDIALGSTARMNMTGAHLTIDGMGHKITRAKGFTGSLFVFAENSNVEIKNTFFDGGTQWSWNQEVLEKDIELSLSDINVLSESAKAQGGGDPVVLGEKIVDSTAPVLECQSGANLSLSENTIFENFYTTGNFSLIQMTSANLRVNNTIFCHNIGGASMILDNSKATVKVDLNHGAEITDNYCLGNGEGGLFRMKSDSVLNINGGAKLSKNVAVNTDGIIASFTSATGTMQGEVSENIGLRGAEYSLCQSFVLGSGGRFTMTGGSIHQNVGCHVGAVSQTKSNSGLLTLNGGRIYQNRYIEKSTGGEIEFTASGLIQQSLEDEIGIYLDENADLTIKPGITVNGDFYVESKSSRLFNQGTVDGSLFLQDGANVTNSGKITGDVHIFANDGTPNKNNFTNSGQIDGRVDVGRDATFDMNGGRVGLGVNVYAGGRLNLKGGSIENDVSIYPDAKFEVESGVVTGRTIIYVENEDEKEVWEAYFQEKGYDTSRVEYRMHEHLPEEPVTKQPTCLDDGLETTACSICRKIVSNEILPALGHDLQDAVVTQPLTCTQPEIQTKACSRCDYKESSVTRQNNGHDYQEDLELRVVARVGIKGLRVYVCSNCGDTINVEVPALLYEDKAHDWQKKEEIKAPTCTETGQDRYECAICHTEFLVPVAALGHDWSEEQEEIPGTRIEPDCEHDGVYTTAIYCKRCQNEDGSRVYNLENSTVIPLPSNGHQWQVIQPFEKKLCTDSGEIISQCTVCMKQQVEKVLATAHDFREIRREPTCTTFGISLKICNVCDYQVSENLPALGHQELALPAVPPTCTKPGLTAGLVCGNCGEVYVKQEEIPATGHRYDDGVVIKKATMYEKGLIRYTCLNCGEVIEKEVERLDFRCKMCDTYEANKDKPVIGVFYKIIHFFVHLGQEIAYSFKLK